MCVTRSLKSDSRHDSARLDSARLGKRFARTRRHSRGRLDPRHGLRDKRRKKDIKKKIGIIALCVSVRSRDGSAMARRALHVARIVKRIPGQAFSGSARSTAYIKTSFEGSQSIKWSYILYYKEQSFISGSYPLDLFIFSKLNFVLYFNNITGNFPF